MAARQPPQRTHEIVPITSTGSERVQYALVGRGPGADIGASFSSPHLENAKPPRRAGSKGFRGVIVIRRRSLATSYLISANRG